MLQQHENIQCHFVIKCNVTTYIVILGVITFYDIVKIHINIIWPIIQNIYSKAQVTIFENRFVAFNGLL